MREKIEEGKFACEVLLEQVPCEVDHQQRRDVGVSVEPMEALVARDSDTFTYLKNKIYVIGLRLGKNGRLEAKYTFVLDEVMKKCAILFGADQEAAEALNVPEDSKLFYAAVHKFKQFARTCQDYGLLVKNDYEVKGVVGVGKKTALKVLSHDEYVPGNLKALAKIVCALCPRKDKDKVLKGLKRANTLYECSVVRTSKPGQLPVEQGYLAAPPPDIETFMARKELGVPADGEDALKHYRCQTRANRYDQHVLRHVCHRLSGCLCVFC